MKTEYTLTDKEAKILSRIARARAHESENFKAYYDLYATDKIGSSSTVWSTLKKLKKIRYIEVKATELFSKIEGKDKQCYGITFKGLLFLLKYGYVKPDCARTVRNLNNIELPTVNFFPGTLTDFPLIPMLGVPLQEMYKTINDLIKEYESTFPEHFYSIVSVTVGSNLADMDERWISFYLIVPALMGVACQYANDPENFKKKFVQGDSFIIGNLKIQNWRPFLTFALLYTQPMFQEKDRPKLQKILIDLQSEIVREAQENKP